MMTTFRCRVILLDDSIIERDLERKAVGQVLFDQVCEYLSLLERDYFGLAVWDSSNNKVWMDLSKRVHKQIMSRDAMFTFAFKFYPPDPSLLAEDITRYLLCLQLRTDILTSHLPCSADMLALLASYTIQSEFGDYNPELHGKEFYSNVPLGPDPSPELEGKVTELHGTLKSLSPAEADQLFLQNVKTLHMYGVHLHPAKDASGGDVLLGVCADGLVVYEDEEITHSFIWPAVLNMSCKRCNFQARIFHPENASENTIKFMLPSYRACKCLWTNAVEHQAFFRDLQNRDTAPKRLLQRRSRLRFDRVTHAESLEASSSIKREAPRFARLGVKRKATESRLVALKRPNRTDFVEWYRVLGSNEPWPAYSPDKFQLTAGETIAHKNRQEADELKDEWFQMLGGRFLPTQHSFSSSSSNTEVLESAELQHWKLQTDDWFVLLEPHTYHPTYWHQRTLPPEEQREELEWVEKHSGKNITIAQIRKELRDVTEQYEELEMGKTLIRPDIRGENLELEIAENEQRLKGRRETIAEDGDGEEFQTVVMYEQRTQRVETYTGQNEACVERIIEMEVVGKVDDMLATGQVVSDETIEELEETLLEVESIEQKLQDIERLKVKLQEVEMLEQRLRDVQQAGRQREQGDDWYILLEHKLTASSAPVRRLGMKTGIKQGQGDRGDWYLLLDRKSSGVSSSTAVDVGVKSSWVNVVQEHKTMEETQSNQENTIYMLEAQPAVPVQREELKRKQVDDDWFIRLSHSPTDAAVNKETREEDVKLTRRQVHMITYEQEEREMIETSHEVIQMNPIPFERRADPSGSSEQKTEIRQWKAEELRKANPRSVLIKDDWYILLDSLQQPTQTTQAELPPEQPTAVDVYKETEEEEVQLFEKQVKTITYEEERREMTEASQKVVKMNPVAFEKRAIPSVPTVDTTQQKAEIRQWVEEEGQRENIPAPIWMKDDWYSLLDSLPESSQTTKPAMSPSVLTTAVDVTLKEEVLLVEKQVKTIKYEEERGEMVATSHELIPMNPIPLKKRDSTSGDTALRKAEVRQWTEEEPQRANTPAPVQVNDDWYILLDSLPRSTQTTKPALPPSALSTAVAVTTESRQKEGQIIKKQMKAITYEEERGEMMEIMDSVRFGKRSVPSEGLRSQQTITIKEKVTFDEKPMAIKEKQVMQGKKVPTTAYDDVDDWFVLFTPAQIVKAPAEVSETWTWKEKRLKGVQEVRRYVMEDKTFHPYVPEPKADVRHREVDDDWFLLLETVSRKSVSVDERAKEDRRRKEEVFKKQAWAEDRIKVAVPVMPLTPAAQPMTSTPTAQSVRVTRPTYDEESLRRLDVTQDVTQDQKKEVETESTISRKRRDKRIEGETIYIRHSILMLEDSDMTQEIVLKHHASISELKRIFMEDIPVFGPTEWDRRLSSYTPVIYPKLSNGELFSGIDIIGASDGLSVM